MTVQSEKVSCGSRACRIATGTTRKLQVRALTSLFLDTLPRWTPGTLHHPLCLSYLFLWIDDLQPGQDSICLRTIKDTTLGSLTEVIGHSLQDEVIIPRSSTLEIEEPYPYSQFHTPRSEVTLNYPSIGGDC